MEGSRSRITESTDPEERPRPAQRALAAHVPKPFVMLPEMPKPEVRPDVFEPPAIATTTQDLPRMQAVVPHAVSIPLQRLIPPQVKREARLVVPSEIRPLLHTDIDLLITAYIDTNGRVYRAQSLTPPDGFVLSSLIRAAEDAATRWQFIPARREGGENLPSQMVLRFKVKAPRR